jgi:hypothetical protein
VLVHADEIEGGVEDGHEQAGYVVHAAGGPVSGSTFGIFGMCDRCGEDETGGREGGGGEAAQDAVNGDLLGVVDSSG